MYSFFALLDRLKYIERWSLMYSGNKENVAEHSHMTAVLAYTLGVINNVEFSGDAEPDRLAALAVFHEAGEVYTGDLPTPIKYSNPEMKNAFKKLERLAGDRLLAHLPEKLREPFRGVIEPAKDAETAKLLKAADKLAALIKCAEELKMGNSEFREARTTLESEIKRLTCPEAEYFLENFFPAYSLALDELK